MVAFLSLFLKSIVVGGVFFFFSQSFKGVYYLLGGGDGLFVCLSVCLSVDITQKVINGLG